ncbi:uncharacterized protein PF3D7_1120000-like [Centruroides vittatus]|uniref:uncharacterized protein PF3D7_1120000-like n=1 Tax=Centruroides vittatus TaxID=120091 RepID=UPI00350FA7A5
MAMLELNPGPFPRSPPLPRQEVMQKRGRGRPRKEVTTDIEGNNQTTEISGKEYLIEEHIKNTADTSRYATIKDFFEPAEDPLVPCTTEPEYSLKSVYELIQDKFDRLNSEIRSMRAEINNMNEENIKLKEEMKEMCKKIRTLEERTDSHSKLKGMVDFEIDKMLNETTKKNLIIFNFPFKTSEYVEELKKFIKENLELNWIEIEGLIQLGNRKHNQVIKVMTESVKDRNLILSKFWTTRFKMTDEKKKIIISTDLCLRSRIRKKLLLKQIKLEKSGDNRIKIRDDYFLKENTMYTYDLNTKEIIQVNHFLETNII